MTPIFPSPTSAPIIIYNLDAVTKALEEISEGDPISKIIQYCKKFLLVSSHLIYQHQNIFLQQAVLLMISQLVLMLRTIQI